MREANVRCEGSDQPGSRRGTGLVERCARIATRPRAVRCLKTSHRQVASRAAGDTSTRRGGVARYVQNWVELHNRPRGRDARTAWFSRNRRCIHLPALKLVLATLNEPMPLLTVPAPAQSNGCIEMPTHHRTQSAVMRQPGQNEGV